MPQIISIAESLHCSQSLIQAFEQLLDALLQGQERYTVDLVTVLRKAQNSPQDPGCKAIQERITRFIDSSPAFITQNNPQAMWMRAWLYQEGIGGPVDIGKAIALFEQAIPLGSAAAMHGRALLHQHGIGGPVDIENAIALLEQAISQGSTEAMTNLALWYVNGIGRPVDFEKAIALLEQAIDQDHAGAMNNRAVMHQYGQGGPVDIGNAITLYEQAIRRGCTCAMTNRARMHQQGLGDPVDPHAAIGLFEQAIACGDPRAMHERAAMFEQGIWGYENKVMASRLYRQAAQAGYHAALNALQASKNIYFQYHCLMQLGNIAAVANLISQHPYLLPEFFVSDCHGQFKSAEQTQMVYAVLSRLTMPPEHANALNKGYEMILMALYQQYHSMHNLAKPLSTIADDCLRNVSMAEIDPAHITAFVHIYTDLWMSGELAQKKVTRQKISHLWMSGKLAQKKVARQKISQLIFRLASLAHFDSNALPARQIKMVLSQPAPIISPVLECLQAVPDFPELLQLATTVIGTDTLMPEPLQPPPDPPQNNKKRTREEAGSGNESEPCSAPLPRKRRKTIPFFKPAAEKTQESTTTPHDPSVNCRKSPPGSPSESSFF
ncbi:MAG: sel1 repeat family protein [Legionellaceae bacterium]|nr:sel1 repeat family protein [Legionellaceae bacterium]